MNPLLAVPADFASLLQRFFAERLIQQQNASPRTVASYRDSFRLLLTYCQRSAYRSHLLIGVMEPERAEEQTGISGFSVRYR